MLTLDTVSKTYRVGTFGGKAIEAVSRVTFDVRPARRLADRRAEAARRPSAA